MEKGTLLVLCLFVCRSSQRPQFEASDDDDDDDAPTTTEPAAATEIAAGTGSGNGTRATEAAAVSVQTTVNVSRQLPSGPGRVFGDFRPSPGPHYHRPDGGPAFERPGPHYHRPDGGPAFERPGPHYHRPDGGPAFERPSPPVTREAFYEPQHFRRPADGQRVVHRFPAQQQQQQQPDDERNVVFPEAQHSAVRELPYDNGTAAGFGRPHNRPFVGVLPQHKPIKHDYAGDALPNFGGFDGGSYYDGPFGKQQTNDVLRYPANDVAARKKKDPWRSVLSVLATILPVGLLLASFPPTVIKVNSTQYPYQFQKNSTAYNPNIVTGRFKALRKKNAGRQINEENKFPGHLDDCLRKKICENIKANHSPSELAALLQNSKLNTTENNDYYGPMVEIAESAVSTSPGSCQVFICNERTYSGTP